MARVPERRDCTRPAEAGSHAAAVACLCLQMVWESGCVAIVMLTSLSENGVRQCYHYWPDEGSSLYHVYEVLPQRTGAARLQQGPSSGRRAGRRPQTFQTAVRWRPGPWHKL